MVSLLNLFSEVANVFSEHPSGLIAPFGSFNSTDKSKKLLSQVQDLAVKNPDYQVKKIK
ncbi:MAG: hypothetical protein WC188_03715 [Candidatus Caldatribacteriota bacterium]